MIQWERGCSPGGATRSSMLLVVMTFAAGAPAAGAVGLDPAHACAVERLGPFVSPTGIHQPWPITPQLPRHLRDHPRQAFPDEAMVADGYQHSLLVDVPARSAYVVQEGGIAGLRTFYGPLPLAACVGPTPEPPPRADPPADGVPALRAEFVPETVFAGRTTGQGTLDLLFSKPRPFSVESHGTLRPDGVFVLEQDVRMQGRPAESRTWHMRRAGPTEYSATLTDSAGPVEAHVEGSRMTLRYPLTKWGLVMHQVLELGEDEKTVANRGQITFLGLTVGEMRETIRLQEP